MPGNDTESPQGSILDASRESSTGPIDAVSDTAKDAVQTPIYTLRNHETGSTVMLLGNIHVATTEYYQILTDHLVALHDQGTMIHLESVRSPTEEQLAAASVEERELVRLLARSLDDGRAPVLGLGLVAKRDVWVSHPDWEIHDVTLLDSVRHLGAEQVQRRAKANRRRRRVLRLMPRSVRRAIIIAQVKAPAAALRRGEDVSRFARGREFEFHMHRESVAMAAVDRHLASHPGSDIALLWGALHLPSLRAAVRERGYTDDGEQWITAIGPELLEEMR